MPKLFTFACIIAALSFLVHAAFTPFYETGTSKLFSPILFITISCFFIAVTFRKLWAWSWVFAASWSFVLISIAFPPMPEHYGSYTFLARVIVGFEVAACVVVFLCMRHPHVKNWFHRVQANPSFKRDTLKRAP